MRQAWMGLAAAFGAAAIAFAGCGDEVEKPTGPTSGSSASSAPSGSGAAGTGGSAGHGGVGTGGTGTGGTSTASTGTGTGGTGGAGGCTASAQCPGMPGDPCVLGTCDNGQCGFANAPTSTVVPQVAGDCQTALCDGTGHLTSTPDLTDLPAASTVCDVPFCTSLGFPAHGPAAVGATCTGTGNEKMCDAAGACVECIQYTDCASGVCQSNACVPAACGDQVKNGNETDVDCGGGTCNPCADGKKCLVPGDCTDAVCTGMVCQAATCSDTVKNGTETDVDCGGTCNPCANGKKCAIAGDCTSKVCSGATPTCQVPACTDLVKNGTETDVDCGGTCPKCGPSKACLINGDCKGGTCDPTGHTCTPDCSDGVKNGSETDVDCGGGGACATCGLGKGCAVNSDCASGVCATGVCSQLNGCDITNTTDMTGMASVTVNFTFEVYTPPCIRVSVGTQVTFSGSFAAHPFQGGVVSGGVATPATTGPFATAVTTGASATYTMTTAGNFPYYCEVHYSGGMEGVVFVQ